ncbi:MAG: hypothetical protein EBZ74_12600 [Planctomycetia bacterium]|nr:hypothetical protein [Planctomycetia bacterium]
MRPLPLAVALTLCSAAPLAATAAEPAAAGSVVDLADRLKAGLRARQPDEFAFLDEVAARVRAGELPGTLVDSTFVWALKRQRKYPYPAFERALRIQAGRIGVEL